VEFVFGPNRIGSAIRKAQKNRCNNRFLNVDDLFIMGFMLLFVFSEFKLRESSLYFQYIFYHCPECADELAKWF
jgi:hypothetical protein